MIVNRPRSALAAVTCVVSCAALGARGQAQTIRVGSESPVSIGLTDRPLGEPMLAIHPANPRHLLGAAIVFDTT
ncbi:MAG: hypothetical protein ABR499_11910, partial [Gemmatimonadaceae bacterium]